MIHPIAVCCCLALVLPLSAEDVAPAPAPLSAQQVAVDMLRESAAARSEGRVLLQRLADGVETGAISLEELDRLLAIAQRLGRIDGAPRRQASSPEIDDDTARRAEAMLQDLQGMPDAVAEAGTETNAESDAAGNADTAAPATGADTRPAAEPAATPAAGAQAELVVAAVREPNEEYPHTLVMFEGEKLSGLARKQRMRISRGSEPLVDVVILKVQAESVMAVVLDATWREAGKRVIKPGDRAVPVP